LLRRGRLRLPLSMPRRVVAAAASPPPDVFEQVRRIYRDLATRPIERQCELRTQCCHFRLTGKTPHLTRGEALLAARAFKATGRKSLPPARQDGACPLLDLTTSRCLIYEDRPFGCRTHFCAAAGGPYARREVIDLIRRLEAIDEQLGGNGPRALPGAVREALEEL
jgi:Fe-S-cluster containining protein